MCRRFFLLSGIIFAAMFFLNDACYASSSCSGCQGCACGGQTGTYCKFKRTSSMSIRIDHLPYRWSVTVDIGCGQIITENISIKKGNAKINDGKPIAYVEKFITSLLKTKILINKSQNLFLPQD